MSNGGLTWFNNFHPSIRPSKTGGQKKPLDLFFQVIFYGWTIPWDENHHEANHHLGEYVWFTFSKHHGQANLRQGGCFQIFIRKTGGFNLTIPIHFNIWWFQKQTIGFYNLDSILRDENHHEANHQLIPKILWRLSPKYLSPCSGHQTSPPFPLDAHLLSCLLWRLPHPHGLPCGQPAGQHAGHLGELHRGNVAVWRQRQPPRDAPPPPP